jgi:hypothetical protein
MKTTINNGGSGLTIRGQLNDMFTELYGALPIPIKLSGVSSNVTQAIAANSFIDSIIIKVTAGTPTINIGTSSGGGDVIISSLVSGNNYFEIKTPFDSSATLYINVSGGTVSVRINLTTSYL